MDSISHADGRLATGAIALCEVQGYVYAARRAGAVLARALGHPERAAMLEGQAEQLRARFELAFWREELGTYALALLERVTIRRLQVGPARVDLVLDNHADDVGVDLAARDGDVGVVITK